MEKQRLSYRTLNKCIWAVLLVFVLVLALRVALIFVPPILIHVSPRLVSEGQRIHLWGIMGSKNARAATTPMLNAVPIKSEDIEHWGFFSLRFKLSAKHMESLTNNAHGLLYLKYKHYQSARFLIALLHSSEFEVLQKPSFIPSVTMRNEQTLYAQNSLVFSLNASEKKVSPLFVEEYSFIIETNAGSYTVYPQEWNMVSDTIIAFPVPFKFFARPPQNRVKASIQVMYKNVNMEVANVELTTLPLLSPEPYEFVVEFVYGTTFRKNVTTLMPLSRPWQYVHFYNKRSNTTKSVDKPQMRTALVRGFIKNFDVKKQTLLITRYPFRPFDWQSRSAAEEHAQALDTEEVGKRLFVPWYLQYDDEYFDEMLFKQIRDVATQVPQEALSLGMLITRLAGEVKPLLVDTTMVHASLIVRMAKGALVNFAHGVEESTLVKRAKKLAILAQLLREYGIPAQVVIGLYHTAKQGMKKTNARTALWLEIFTSEYGIVPLQLSHDFSNVVLTLIDYRFVGYAVLEQMAYLKYLNQRPTLPSALRSFTLRN